MVQAADGSSAQYFPITLLRPAPGDSWSLPADDTMVSRMFLLFLLGAIALGTACPSLMAHSAAGEETVPDQYDLGIPVYWPLHAFLMLAGFALLVSGLMVMRYQKTKDWFRTHRILQATGGILFIAGLATSYAMVSISESPHFRYFHGILGISTIVLILCMLVLGFYLGSYRHAPHYLRTVHRRLGYIVIGLVLVNILSGFIMMGTVLSQ